MMKGNHADISGRRKFITTVGKLAAPSVILTIPAIGEAEKLGWQKNPLTVQQVIDLILKQIPNPRTQNTVDKIRSGSPDQVVNGIVTTMFPTIVV
jgi:hypothetical protein